MPCSRMTWSQQPNEWWPQHQSIGTTVEAKEKGVERAKIGETRMDIELQDMPFNVLKTKLMTNVDPT